MTIRRVCDDQEKSTPRQTKPMPRRIEIAPQVLKKVKHLAFCCLCGKLIPIEGEDDDAVVPICQLVTPEPNGKEQRQELGQLCDVCTSHAKLVDVSEFKKYINTGIIWRCQDILKAAYLFQDLELIIPPQHVWIAAAAECLANNGPGLRDLVRKTGLTEEEILRRLIARAKPEDLRSEY
jgi:hypothetical protein